MKPERTNAELEQWADQQRQDYHKRKLSAFQINKLEETRRLVLGYKEFR